MAETQFSWFLPSGSRSLLTSLLPSSTSCCLCHRLWSCCDAPGRQFRTLGDLLLHSPGTWVKGMSSAVEYSPVGEGLGMREYWLYVWLRRAAVTAAHFTGIGLTTIIAIMSRPGTSKPVSYSQYCISYSPCQVRYIYLYSIYLFYLFIYFSFTAQYNQYISPSCPSIISQSSSLSQYNQLPIYPLCLSITDVVCCRSLFLASSLHVGCSKFRFHSYSIFLCLVLALNRDF